MEILSIYNFEILYKKGNKNRQVDTLSQKADYIQEKPEVLYTILRKYSNSIVYNYPKINTIKIEIVIDKELVAIQSIYATNTIYKKIQLNILEYLKYRITEQEAILFEKQILVPKLIKISIVLDCYKQLLYRYPEIRKTIKLVFRTFYFLRIRKIVEKVINIYNKYCRNKAARYLLYKKLQLLRAPAGI